ncbi:MAG: acyltransferase family protein [Pseudomonadota bacterium]
MGNATGRLHGLDFLRALMMSLGVVLHTAQLYLTMPIVDYYWDEARSPTMDVILIVINTFRMPVFFLLSGFFTALLLDKRGVAATIENRKQRIVLPFLIFLPVLAVTMTPLRVIGRYVMANGAFGFDMSLIDRNHDLWNNTHNLWFLYYLIFHLCTAWLVVFAWRRLPDGRRHGVADFFRRGTVYTSPAFLMVCFGLAGLGATQSIGRVSANLSFALDVKVYLYFGLCFFLGWALHQRMQDLATLARRWRRDMAVATGLLLAALIIFSMQGGVESEGPDLARLALSVASGFSVGFYMLAFVGLFSKHFQSPNRWVRYFSDSSYWIYVFHSIPVVAVALLLHDWAVPAEVKFLVVCAGATLACLVTYQLFVRNGPIGELLNGRRYDAVPWRV